MSSSVDKIRELSIDVESEKAIHQLASNLAEKSQGRGVFFLSGQLGAGKTTFCRGLIRYFGHQGAVKSPTFTLVEPYHLQNQTIYHLDLYRLTDAGEAEYLGLDEYFDASALCLVEWPEKGGELLPDCDLAINILTPGEYKEPDELDSGKSGQNSEENGSTKKSSDENSADERRRLILTAVSSHGSNILRSLKESWED